MAHGNEVNGSGPADGQEQQPSKEQLMWQTLQQQVFQSAKDGLDMTLFTLLADQAIPQRRDLLSMKFKDDSGEICPLLVLAARLGHTNCVKKILSLAADDQIDVEVRGDVIFRHTLIEGATALWAAACAGHLEVVQVLCKAGADANTTTLGTSKSPPLRVAGLEGHFDVVLWMLENTNADINGANMYDNTCLMVAAYKGHADIVKVLLNKGALIDLKAKCGTTALHLAAEEGRLEVVKLLVARGSDTRLKDVRGLTPVMMAANATREQVVDYLMSREAQEDSDVCGSADPYSRRVEAVDVWELMATAWAVPRCGTTRPEPDKAFECWQRAMRLRLEEPALLKPLAPPGRDDDGVYDGHVEASSLEDVEAVRASCHEEDAVTQDGVPVGVKMIWEALVTRERILGPTNTGVPPNIFAAGATFADARRYRKCICLWVHALRLQSATKTRLDSKLESLVGMLSLTLLDGKKKGLESAVTVDDFLFVLNTALEEMKNMKLYVQGKTDLIKNKVSLQRISLMHRDLELEDPMRATMKSFLNLLTIFVKNSKNYNKRASIFGPQDQDRVMAVLEDALRINPRDKDGASLLHLTVVSEMSCQGTQNLVRYPCPNTTRTLLTAGWDPNGGDHEGNTPLHYIVSYKEVVLKFQSLLSCTKVLLKGGAHSDIMNKAGRTAYAHCATGVAQTILRSTDQLRINLKCSCARVLKKHKIVYKGNPPLLPKHLEEFVDIHSHE